MPTLLITGTNRGLGLTFTRAYLQAGWQVHACCRHPEKAADLKALAEDHQELELHKLDVTNGLQVSSLARQLRDEKIDLLLNNAGIMGGRFGFGEIDYEEWNRVLETNCLAPLRLAEAFVEQVGASERKQIVTISSIMGSVGSNEAGGGYVYRSSKAALNAAMKSLSLDLADREITVTVCHPGWVQTDMGGSSAPVTIDQSIAGLKKIFDGLTLADSGKFYNYDGSELPW
ncbi:SDR family oxidoreductase [Rhodovibrionaceae bacterium A322]